MNQHTFIEYSENEIKEIILLYNSRVSISKISYLIKRNRNGVKKILIDNNIWVENRDILKKTFTDEDIKKIINLYVDDNLSCESISKLYNTSKNVINRELKNIGLLREGCSSGKKINLTTEQEILIKKLYLEEYKSTHEISEILALTSSFINKYLSTTNYRRNKEDSFNIGLSKRIGVKRSKETIQNMKNAQKKISDSGNRVQRGGICKIFEVNGLRCQGTYEKFYIEWLLKNNIGLPSNSEPIITPYGVYYPDYSYGDRLIEIKSDYTYDILIGLKESSFTKKIDLTQYKKIIWVNKNKKPINILVVDKRNNMIIKKEIE